MQLNLKAMANGSAGYVGDFDYVAGLRHESAGLGLGFVCNGPEESAALVSG
ncbi:MAG: hypothetical protein U0Y68_16830 [Blastocatellia bacterium]